MIHRIARPLSVDVVLGTRPEAVKLLPVLQALRADERFETRLVATGQHRELLDQILDPFGIRPDVDLNAMRAGQSLSELVGRLVPSLDRVFASHAPDVVLVQGDTTSAFAAALAAHHGGLRVGHVEAGLRSFDRHHPFPEESNRRMIGAVADLHFAPTAAAARNLLREGVPRDAVLVTGNTAIDALLAALPAAEREAASGPSLRDAAPLVLVTLHRRESLTRDADGRAPLEGILAALADTARAHPDVDVVYPVHCNPAVRSLAGEWLEELPNVQLVAPQPYLGFVRLMARAHVIVSDSGGVQEEAPTLGVPVLVAREVTERPEGLHAARNRLVGTSRSDVREALEIALAEPPVPAAARPHPNPFGDGHAAERIRDAIAHAFRRGARPAPFDEPSSGAAIPPRIRTRLQRARTL